MTQPPMAVTLREVESLATHWVGHGRNLVVTLAFEGSQEDPQHVATTARVVEERMRDTGAPVRLLFCVPGHGRPPDARVRSAILQAAKRVEGSVAEIAVVVVGDGFGSALQRSVVTGVLAVLRPSRPVRVVSSVRDGLAALLGKDAPGLDPLAASCDARLRNASSRRP